LSGRQAAPASSTCRITKTNATPPKGMKTSKSQEAGAKQNEIAPEPARPTPTRTVLIAVTGRATAVLTETIWALAKEKKPVIPDDIICITTKSGAGWIQSELDSPLKTWGEKSVLQSLRESILGERKAAVDRRLMLGATRVIELPNPVTGRSEPAEDLRTVADNEAAADFILDVVRSVAGEHADTQVIALIAGGRKTMGALLHAAMSLLGRRGDRVLHVLVDDPSDVLPGFYFPGQPVQEIIVRDGRKLKAKELKISLAEVPFVPLWKLVKKAIGKGPASFMSLTRKVGDEVESLLREDVRLVIRRSLPEVFVNEVLVKLSVWEYAILHHLAEAAIKATPAKASYADAVDAVKVSAKAIYDSRSSGTDWRAKLCDSVKADFSDLSEEWLIKKLDSLRAKLKKHDSTEPLCACLPERGRWSLEVRPALISFRD